MDEENNRVGTVPGIQDVPNEILEYILSLVSPYEDYKHCMLVSKHWYYMIKGVAVREKKLIYDAIKNGDVEWIHCRPPVVGTTIAERYSHSACYIEKSLYIFGGCTASNTTFNDLWRYDLSLRKWIRPVAIGTYPSPKACASLVAYKNNLVLFGGWSQSTPYPLHLAAKFFNELHIYSLSKNAWSIVYPNSEAPPGTAGHSASVVGDKMVIFGGSHGKEMHFSQGNDLWEYDFNENTWFKHSMKEPCPLPRYGHSQTLIDDNHLLIVGGCGGANMQFNDVWLLTFDCCNNQMDWTKINVKNTENAPSQLWCHSACKVDDAVVILSKSSNAPAFKKSGISSLCNGNKNKLLPSGSTSNPASHSHHWTRLPPRSSSMEGDFGENSNNIQGNASVADVSSSASSDSNMKSNAETKKGANNFGSAARSGMPSIRPNAMRNRQKQLETLKKYEDLIKNFKSKNIDSPKSTESVNYIQSSQMQNPMFIHILNISQVLSEHTAFWEPIDYSYHECIPEETIFYSLTLGRGELIMFGGIKTDLKSMQRGFHVNSKSVSNNIHFIRSVKFLR